MISARVFGCFLIFAALIAWQLAGIWDSKMTLFVSCMMALFGIAACIRIRANPETLSKKQVLITGCDSGIGQLLARSLLSHGARVAAGFLNNDCAASKKLQEDFPDALCLQMDVTNEKQVAAAVDCVREKMPDLCAVINNAGIQFSGDLEMHTMTQYRQVMEVNYFGTVRVTKSFLPMLRKNKGRLINVSSVRGRNAWAFAGAYTATKFALEAFSDTLRLEVRRFGVPVVIIEPGHFGGATGMLNDSDRISKEFQLQWDEASPEVQEAYGLEYCEAVKNSVLAGCQDSGTDLTPVINAFIDAVASDAPKERYLISGTNNEWLDDYKWTAVLRDWLPSSLHDELISWFQFSELVLPEQAKSQSK